jgi:hypothetical protein
MQLAMFYIDSLSFTPRRKKLVMKFVDSLTLSFTLTIRNNSSLTGSVQSRSSNPCLINARMQDQC